jgi:20S proteasome alpha/beta subunit
VKGYRPNLSLEDALALATQAVEGVNGGKSVIEHGIVTTKSKKFEHQDLANAVA